jgi:hypothetical protein
VKKTLFPTLAVALAAVLLTAAAVTSKPADPVADYAAGFCQNFEKAKAEGTEAPPGKIAFTSCTHEGHAVTLTMSQSQPNPFFTPQFVCFALMSTKSEAQQLAKVIDITITAPDGNSATCRLHP